MEKLMTWRESLKMRSQDLIFSLYLWQQFELKGCMFSLAWWCLSAIEFARQLALSHRGYVMQFTQEVSF